MSRLPARERRPLNPGQQSKLNGGWNWVNVPQSILINQKASFYDCPLRCATAYSIALVCSRRHATMSDPSHTFHQRTPCASSPTPVPLTGGHCLLRSPPAATPANVLCSVDRYTVPWGIIGQPMASAANPGDSICAADDRAQMSRSAIYCTTCQ
jgi:hypothetical protein